MRAFSMFIPYAALAMLTTCAPEPPASGAKLYRQNCVACHGVGGAGNGPLAGDLPIAPADLTGISRRNGGVFPKADVMITIHGYTGQETQGLMPGFGAVLSGPMVMWRGPDGVDVPTPQALLAVADYVETLQDP